MTKPDTEILNTFLESTSVMQLHSSAKLGSALKKPLLLLLVISKIEHGGVRENRFHFSEIRDELSNLIRRYGGRPTRSGPKPEQPFTHLRTSGFWHLTTHRAYTGHETALVSDLMSAKSYAALQQDIYNLLLRSKEARAQVFQHILERWWPETIHDEIRDELGMEELRAPTKPRDAKFVDQVLENYRFTCSFCGFHAMLNRQAIGVDACHIRWHSAGGPDIAANGIALCKLHHWAFDKGVITLDSEMKICTASTFVVHSDGGLPLHSLSGKPLISGPSAERPGAVYLQWHRANVYLG